MFGSIENSNDIALFALVALGLYANCHDLNLASNTTILLILFGMFYEHKDVEKLKSEVCCIEGFTGTTACKCGMNRFRGSC